MSNSHNITHTECGRAIMINKDVCTIPQGRIALAILVDQGNTFGLVFERGGDWMAFGDDARHNADEIDGWEIEALREAVPAAIALAPEAAEDLDWYLEWADDAENTVLG